MKEINVQFLGTVPYGRAWEMQKELFSNLTSLKQEVKNVHMHLLLLEHPHVYTMGMHGDVNNILVNEEFMKSIGAEYFRIERGGDITYHGYGQLVGYPILDLERFDMGIREYIWTLEEAVIMTVASYGIVAGRVEGAVGVWVDPTGDSPRKVCAIGVKASRYVTMHGFALNVTTDLKYFSYINPCGFTDRGVTSIQKECGAQPSIEQVSELFTNNLFAILKGRI